MKWFMLLPVWCLLGVAALAEEKPEALLATAKKLMAPHPWKIDAIISGDKSYRLHGIVAGQDFDLTIRDPKTKTRQIVVGEKAWSSTDGGKTWKPAKTVDRRFYHLAHTPIGYRENEKFPPFEKLKTVEENGETLMHVRFIAPDETAYEGDRPNAWMILKDGAPTGVRRYHGPLVLDREIVTAEVRYAAPKDAAGVLPPPGNPEAVPDENTPEAALTAALKKMESGLWEVKGTIAGPKTLHVQGLINGRDFDLTYHSDDGKPADRQIAIKDKSWSSKDGGKTWKSVSADDRLIYNFVHTPLLSNRMQPDFEEAGREEHDGEKWVHLQLKVPEKLASETQRPHYWLALDATGKPTAIRRHHGPIYMSKDAIVDCKLDYSPPKERTIAKPPGVK
jgi:hypothetical protein